jgi:hypothetical protein
MHDDTFQTFVLNALSYIQILAFMPKISLTFADLYDLRKTLEPLYETSFNPNQCAYIDAALNRAEWLIAEKDLFGGGDVDTDRDMETEDSDDSIDIDSSEDLAEDFKEKLRIQECATKEIKPQPTSAKNSTTPSTMKNKFFGSPLMTNSTSQTQTTQPEPPMTPGINIAAPNFSQSTSEAQTPPPLQRQKSFRKPACSGWTTTKLRMNPE